MKITHQLKNSTMALTLLSEERSVLGERVFLNDQKHFVTYGDSVVEPYVKPDPMDGVPAGALVLVRDKDDYTWFVRRYKERFGEHYHCRTERGDGISQWTFCIPLAGNEHLAFTKDMPSVN